MSGTWGDGHRNLRIRQIFEEAIEKGPSGLMDLTQARAGALDSVQPPYPTPNND